MKAITGRIRWALLAATLAVFALAAQPAFATHDATGVPYAVGDVFAGVGMGKINHFSPTGLLKHTLDTTSASFEDTGMCFDGPGNLYSTNFTASNATKFNNVGNLLTHPWASGFTTRPESCVVNAAGDVWVGSVDPGDLRRFAPAGGAPVETDTPLTGPRGVDWIDLAADQCTMHYTSEGPDIRRWDVCTNTQLADFANGLAAPCFALRIRANGEVLVACRSQAVRLSSAGAVLQTYPAAGFTPPAGFLFALNLDPDGTSFWTGDILAGDIYRIDIATGAQITSFPSMKTTSMAGLALFGEPTQGGGGQCPPEDDEENDDDDNDGLTNRNELLFLTLVNNPDSDFDGIKDGNDDEDEDGEDDEDEDDDEDECPDPDEDDDGEDDEDEDDDNDAPSIGSPTLSASTINAGQTTTLSVTASDAQSGLGDAEFFIGTDLGVGNNRPLTQESGGFSSAPFGDELTPGTYDIGVRARDVEFNWSGVQYVTLTVTGPTAVVLRSFGASRMTRGVVVRWRTASEASIVGFHLYRGQLRLTRTMLSVRGGASAGSSYVFVDRGAPRGTLLRYRLQAVQLDGKRRWAGTVLVAAR